MLEQFMGKKKRLRIDLCELNPVYFYIFRECQVKKERKERLAFLAHRYYFYFFSLLPSALEPFQGEKKDSSF